MKTQTPTDERTLPEVWSDLYQTWTQTLFSTRNVPDTSDQKPAEPQGLAMQNPWQAAWDYWVDTWQRTVLFWDVMRQRSDQYYAQKDEGGAARAEFRRRTGAGRPHLRQAGQLSDWCGSSRRPG